MTTKNDGGPAFPTVDANRAEDCGTYGMTLRDHFAGLAMQAAISGHISHYGHDSVWPAKALAEEAWIWADAMLDARGEA